MVWVVFHGFSRRSWGAFRAGLPPKGRFGFAPGRLNPPRGHHPVAAEELNRLGWAESDLATRRKSDAAKLRMAARRPTATTLSIKAIARRVHPGSSKSGFTHGTGFF